MLKKLPRMRREGTDKGIPNASDRRRNHAKDHSRGLQKQRQVEGGAGSCIPQYQQGEGFCMPRAEGLWASLPRPNVNMTMARGLKGSTGEAHGSQFCFLACLIIIIIINNKAKSTN